MVTAPSLSIIKRVIEGIEGLEGCLGWYEGESLRAFGKNWKGLNSIPNKKYFFIKYWKISYLYSITYIFMRSDHVRLITKIFYFEIMQLSSRYDIS
jgi:hypothetical protein